MTNTLMAMGGAVDMRGACVVLREFCRLAGGTNARIVILPTASTRPTTGQRYTEAFSRLGVRLKTKVLPIATRMEALQPAHAQTIAQATGIFITGGNQMRLSALLGGTPVDEALQAAYAHGVVVGGTSAGAAILSTTMLSFGNSGPTPLQGLASFMPGLGFTRRIIFDQHFRQRDRLGRLLLAVANHPGVFGVGLDENTAVVLKGEHLRVLGAGAVTVVDGHELTASTVAEIDDPAPAAMANVRLHILTHGCTFDLKRRIATVPRTRPVQAGRPVQA